MEKLIWEILIGVIGMVVGVLGLLFRSLNMRLSKLECDYINKDTFELFIKRLDRIEEKMDKLIERLK